MRRAFADRAQPDADATGITLAASAVGSRVTLVGSVPATVTPARHLRLAELGLRRGCEVVVLSRTPGGGRVLAVGTARIALGRDLVRSLAVQPTTS